MTMTNLPTRFSTGLGLSELPWFETRDGRLCVADPDVGPIIDMHTHLALSFGRRARVDLRKEHPQTEHYLPMTNPLDLEVYGNKNYQATDLRRLKRDLTINCLGGKGMRRTHTAANLTREMDDLGIHFSLLLPIDLPVLSSNADTYLELAATQEKLGSLGCVHPKHARIGDRLESQKARGAMGVKLHPAVQLFAPDDPRAMAIYPICGELDLPVLLHAGPVGIETRRSRACSQMKHYWRPIKENPNTTFILAHSGALQPELALELAQNYKNCWLGTACQSLPAVRQALAEGPKDRIMHGSDWPFYHQAMSVAKLLIATDGDPGLRRATLWDNAARLFGIDPPAAT
ncbi:MAG: amidohydrolase family protein [Planctomycetota bacterium]|jgi:predicted TIM-barrel fold metal-dependent hydrolase